MSLPSRERGLKSFADEDFTSNIESLPSRERGLKSTGRRLQKQTELLSLPSRERGLK